MSCYEWRYNISLSGLSITADIAYEEPSPDPELPPISITIVGTQTYSDVGPPYSRRTMRCGNEPGVLSAYREGVSSYFRFRVDGIVAPTTYEESYPLVIENDNEPLFYKAGVFDSSESFYPIFPMGLFKPWDSSDPAYVCADGIWRKSTNYTKGFLRILTEEGIWLATGVYDRIEPGGAVSYYKFDDMAFETIIGTGTMDYIIS
jgi:hypothetical protein